MPAENLKRVLVVDDDPSIRMLLATLLGQLGLEVSTAADGKQALDLMREQRFAVVILDLLVPGTNGFEVLEELKRDDGRFAPVVLVLTGADRGIVDRLDPKHIHGIVRKPFDPAELASVVVACAESAAGADSRRWRSRRCWQERRSSPFYRGRET